MSTLPKANPGALVMEKVTNARMVNRAMDHLSQGVRHHAEDCVALGVINNPLEAPSSTPLYLCLPPTWGMEDGRESLTGINHVKGFLLGPSVRR
jgi:hypothetical protein